MPGKFKFINNYRQKYFWMDSSILLIIAALTGVGTGFAAIGFKLLIQFFHGLFFSGGEQILTSSMGKYYIILLPALGGLLVGFIIHFFAREAKGHGVPEVMAAVAEKDGVMRPRLVLIKALASSISIGSGGSVGREGPIVQIGSALGSSIAQVLRMSPAMMKTLVACGAAGGISATFNAPIGGVIFAQELILGEFVTSNFILIVISSVVSAIISRAFWGDFPAFMVQAYYMVNPAEMGFYLILGLLAGLLSVLYIKVLYKTEDFFDNMTRIPEYFRPVLGGLLVGAIGLFYPQVFGVGYETVELVLENALPWLLVFVLLFVKLIATSITIGSGGSGGVFAPGLFMGSMLGGSFGVLVHSAFPALTAPAGAYALVGMGGVFAGMAQAPITGIIIIFEMTGDYKVILPLMVVCVISALVARALYPETIYTVKLVRRGLNVRRKNNVGIMAEMPVSKVMTTRVQTLDASIRLSAAKDIVLESVYTGFPVLEGNKLVGITTYEDILKEIKKGNAELSVGEILRNDNDLITVTPYDSIQKVMDKMAGGDIGRLPVVNADKPEELLGIISRNDIINAYSLAANGDIQTSSKKEPDLNL